MFKFLVLLKCITLCYILMSKEVKVKFGHQISILKKIIIYYLNIRIFDGF